MPLTFTDTPLYYKDSQGNYQRILSGADMTEYRTAVAQDVIDAGKEASGLGLTGASVGDLVRVNAVDNNGKPTSWKHVALNEIKCNKNYLINHYMGGGGSQRMDKKDCLPINQRGQTTYSNGGYGLDMWRLSNGATINVANKYVELINTQTGYPEGFSQRFPLGFFEEHDGEFVTISALTFDGKLYKGTTQVDSTTGYTWVHWPESSRPNDVGFQISIGKNTNNPHDHVRVCAAENSSTQIVDIKLEFSPEQTLCHNEGTEENPVWVLNEVPDYGEELAKCQRYFVRLSGSSNFIGSGFIQDSTTARASFPMPKMAKNSPTVTLNGTMYMQVAGHVGPRSLAISTILDISFNTGSLFIYVGGLSDLTPGQGCLMQLRDNTSYIDISAEP